MTNPLQDAKQDSEYIHQLSLADGYAQHNLPGYSERAAAHRQNAEQILARLLGRMRFRTKSGVTVTIVDLGPITQHDDSGGGRWDKQEATGDNGVRYSRRRMRPNWNHVRDNYGAAQDDAIDADEDLGWGKWMMVTEVGAR